MEKKKIVIGIVVILIIVGVIYFVNKKNGMLKPIIDKIKLGLAVSKRTVIGEIDIL